MYYGTGRRKHSIARVRVYPGSGTITINDRDIDEYFGLDTLKLIVRQPLALTDTLKKFDIVCNVVDGSLVDQAFAIRYGLSKALIQYSDKLRPILKITGLLTSNLRMKERKKIGHKFARRLPQLYPSNNVSSIQKCSKHVKLTQRRSEEEQN